MKYLFLLFILNSVSYFSQDYYYDHINFRGDTTKLPVYKNPSVCDCHHAIWNNKEQKKICALTYDYDFMSEEEQENYDSKLETCKYPSICDCANLSNKNKGLIKSCDENFNYKGISEQSLKENIKLLAKCPKDKKEEKFSICDCLNVSENAIRIKCDETFFGDSINETQRTVNQNLLIDCIKNKEYEMEITTCDCALFSKTDAEYKKLCDKKIEDLKQNKRALSVYLYSLKVCKETDLLTQYLEQKNIPEADYKYSVCQCNEEELEKETIEKCNSIWNYKTMNKEQQAAFSNAVERCNQ